MYIVDGHCDTLLALQKKSETLRKNSLQISLERIKQTNSEYLQFYAVFVSPSIKGLEAISQYKNMVNILQNECKENNIPRILTKNDLDFKGHGALLSVEGLYFLDGKQITLDDLYADGVRCLSMTWNGSNIYARGVLGNMHRGITKKGKELVRKAEKLGIVLDVSHLDDESFYDLSDMATKPFVATHSNARAICKNSRNLTDEMLVTLKKHKGVTGINMYGRFLKEQGETSIVDIIRHIEHICMVASVDTVGFGTDFDGIPREHSAIDSPYELIDVLEQLAILNYTQEQINKIAGGNFLRVLTSVLK
ncbi:MAG: membrane dipeptidase [Clostridiales bacterium]|nr:membrane dipeptidase [Clostridiales bacterium]